MRAKTIWALTLCVLYSVAVQSSIIKTKNVPRVGRSNEADGYYDHEMGYVIKSIPNKNIPRMGRRNYDSENRFDIPKLYATPYELAEDNEDGSPTNRRYNEDQHIEMMY